MLALRRGSVLTLATMALLALLAPIASAATGSPSSGSSPVVAEDRSSLELVAEAYALNAHNEQRAAGRTRNGATHTDVSGGGKALVGYSDITTVARRWADAISFDDFRHNPDYSRQYDHWRGASENIAITTVKSASRGTPSTAEVRAAAEDLMQSWWNSGGHRRNWMDHRWEHVGVGASLRVDKVDFGSGTRDYWVLTLVANFRDHDGSRIDGTPFTIDGSNPPNETAGSTSPSASGTGSTPASSAMAISGDWDGDGLEDLGWYDRGDVRLRMGDGTVRSFHYGRPGDVPIVGDWDGDGIDTVSVIRDRVWHLNNAHGGGAAYRSFVYGRLTSGDKPLVGDWDGDGRDGIGIVRNGEWHLRNDQSGGPGKIVFTYGRVLKGDVPVIGDWNGDGSDTIGIVRGSEWHLRSRLAGGPADHVVNFGRAQDLPVAGDFDGDGVTTFASVRGSTWYLRNDLSGGGAQDTARFGM